MRNTALLYFRMALMMCINLYTSRVVLQVLGVEDYGIFYVVWGIVFILNFINDSMTASTQRFLTFELGTGNKKRLHEVFITSVHIHLIISLFLIISLCINSHYIPRYICAILSCFTDGVQTN